MFYLRLVICAFIVFDALSFYGFFDFSGSDLERPFSARRFQRNVNGNIEQYTTLAQLPSTDGTFGFNSQISGQVGQNAWFSDRSINALMLENAKLEAKDTKSFSTKMNESKSGNRPVI